MSGIGSTEAFVPKPLTATATVKDGAGVLGGIFCSTTSSGTVTVYDNTAASGTPIVATITLAAGTFYRLPAAFATGLHVVIANTASITVFYI